MGATLKSMVRGDWSRFADCGWRCAEQLDGPDRLSLEYCIIDDPQSPDRKEASVAIEGASFRVSYWSHGKSRGDALRNLLTEWRHKIVEYANTVHPSKLRGAQTAHS